jgi:hypothetical protein
MRIGFSQYARTRYHVARRWVESWSRCEVGLDRLYPAEDEERLRVDFPKGERCVRCFRPAQREEAVQDGG